MTVEARKRNKGGDKRQEAYISDRRQRISESFADAAENSEELKKSFDEWMKIKINATNSWTLALIDYFHDLTLLREGDSINFQKASCTLDGCVKIYTSRVDSVDVETKKLLNGLQTYGNNANETIDTEEGEAGQVKSKKREHRHTNTLEKDITNLDLKKFDIEFVVDPLFRKTSADFDEGGARGLLLNHLNISSNGRLIFDAGDISLDSDRAKEQVLDSSWIDYDKLKGHFNLSKLWESELCWALRNFEFSQHDSQICEDIDFTKEADPRDFYDFSPNFDDQNDQDSIGGNDLPDMAYEDHEMALQQGNLEAENESFAAYLPATRIQDGLFSYFDTSLFRNWAGPEHWRSKPLSSKKNENPKSSRKIPKEFEIIDFLDSAPFDCKKLFSQGTSLINLPKNERQKSNFLLPEDLHISPKDIGRLFSNPEHEISFKSKRQDPMRALSNDQNMNMLDGLEKENVFWANYEMIIPNVNDNIPLEDNTPQGFEFDPYDDDDEVDFGNQGETPEGAPDNVSVFLDYGDQLVEPPKKVFAVPLRYAKTAKRVDVKKLKDNIWKEMLDINDQESELNPATFEKPKKFSELVSGLNNFYPEQKRQDISAAFCFICVLHLANEQNLSIKGSAQLEDLIICQNK